MEIPVEARENLLRLMNEALRSHHDLVQAQAEYNMWVAEKIPQKLMKKVMEAEGAFLRAKDSVSRAMSVFKEV